MEISVVERKCSHLWLLYVSDHKFHYVMNHQWKCGENRNLQFVLAVRLGAALRLSARWLAHPAAGPWRPSSHTRSFFFRNFQLPLWDLRTGKNELPKRKSSMSDWLGDIFIARQKLPKLEEEINGNWRFMHYGKQKRSTHFQIIKQWQ